MDLQMSPDDLSNGCRSRGNLKSVVAASWSPAEIEAEYCSEAKSLFVQRRLGSAAVSQKVRKHLSALRWRIESKRDQKIRFRYISPDGKTYYSLSTACRTLVEKHETEDHTSNREAPVEENCEAGYSEDAAACRSLVENHKTDDRSCNREIPVDENCEAGYSEDSVKDYCDYMILMSQNSKQQAPSADVKFLRLNAKRHLISKGWKSWFVQRKTRKAVLYGSPDGKCFQSLYVACKDYLEELHRNPCPESRDLKRQKMAEDLPMTSSTPSRKSSLSTVTSSDENDKDVAAACNGPTQHSRKRKVAQSSPDESQKSTGNSRRWSRKEVRDAVVSYPGRHFSAAVLASLTDNGVVLPRQRVSYIRKTDGHALKRGTITPDGIKCGCCRNMYTPTDFEAHAGSNSNQPAANIFLHDGRSLLQCQEQLIHIIQFKSFPHMRIKCDYSHSQEDSMCSVCQEGGELLLCEHCPSAFHVKCVGLQDVPEGNWFCPCCRCGICGLSDCNSDAKQFTNKTMLCCDQCERQYHVGCLRESRMSGLHSCPTGDWFCSKNCSKIFYSLRKLVGKSIPTSVKGLSWALLRLKGGHGAYDVESRLENHSKLCAALDVLHECFVPITEPRTQSDFIADILFNRESDLRRLGFWGFYTMILEKGDELVSVSTFRVCGDKVAEMPLIGTRFQHRKQGFCRLLVNELEKLLSGLGVERLVLPAVPQVLKAWTNSFGFTKMASSDRLELLDYTLLRFQDTTMCQKFLR